MMKKLSLTLAFALLGSVFLPLGHLKAEALTFPDKLSVPGKACQVADDWAKRLVELPKTYEEINALPLSHRKAVYRRLSPTEQASLWQTQWETALSREDLTASQEAVLFDALQILSADTIVSLKGEDGWRHAQAWEQLRALEAHALDAFGKQEAGRLFAAIGPVRSWTVKIVDEDVSAPIRLKGTSEACSCSKQSDYCPSLYDCVKDSDGCIAGGSCGFLWLYLCDGECLLSSDPLDG